MVLRGRGPWLVSTALHLGLGCLVLVLVFQEPQNPPQVLKMRLVSPAGAPSTAPVKTSSWVPPPSPPAASAPQATIPSWQPVSPVAAPPPVARVPVSLDELLGALVEPSPADQAPPAEVGWTGPGGLGYSPPPLPPPRLAPPQGAFWSLVLSIPGGGGFARSFEGLDSGHPDLDRWLEEYLRTVSFPSSPGGEDYTLRWTLRLETGRPR